MNSSFKIKNHFLGFINSSRLATSLIVGALLQLKGASDVFSLNVVFFLMLSFLFNDYCDIDKDRLGAKHKASTTGLVDKSSLGAMTLITFFLAMLCLFNNDYQNIFPYIFAYSGSFLYSKILKPNIPTFATALWCFVVVSFVFYPFNLSWSENLSLIIFFFARELLLDLRDIAIDSAYCKTKSLPNIFGVNRTLLLCISLATLASIALGILTEDWFSVFSFSCAIIIASFGLMPKFFNYLKMNSLKISYAMFIPMIAYFFI
jgi:UbiA prenyltransferase family